MSDYDTIQAALNLALACDRMNSAWPQVDEALTALSRLREIERVHEMRRVEGKRILDERQALEGEVARLRVRQEKQEAALSDSVVWLEDAARLIDELADDLKNSYEPEKGWPSHIEAASNMTGDLKDMVADAREALAPETK